MKFLETIAAVGITSFGIHSYLNFSEFIKDLKLKFDFKKKESGMIESEISAINKDKMPYRIKRISVMKSPIMMISGIKGNDLRSAISVQGMPGQIVSLGNAMYNLELDELKDSYLEIEFVFAGFMTFVRNYKPGNTALGNDFISPRSGPGCRKRKCNCGCKNK